MRIFSLSLILLLFIFSICNAQPRARLSGTITICTTEEPLEGVCITCETADPVYTDVDGHYTLAITGGTYNITMEKEGFGLIDLPATNLVGIITLDTCLQAILQPEISPQKWIDWIMPGNSTVEGAIVYNNGSTPFHWHAIVEYEDWREKNIFSTELITVTVDPDSGYIEPGEEDWIDLTAIGYLDGSCRTGQILFHCGEEDIIVSIDFELYCQWFGIEELGTKGVLSVSPNPSSGEITLQTPEAQGTWNIIDIDGSVKATGTTNDCLTELQLSDIASGIYMLVWRSDAHAPIATKFVKQ